MERVLSSCLDETNISIASLSFQSYVNKVYRYKEQSRDVRLVSSVLSLQCLVQCFGLCHIIPSFSRAISIVSKFKPDEECTMTGSLFSLILLTRELNTSAILLQKHHFDDLCSQKPCVSALDVKKSQSIHSFSSYPTKHQST